MDESFVSRIKEAVGEDNVKCDEPMADHCTFKCGGKAAVYATPQNEDDVVSLVKLCRDSGMPYIIFGAGSNILVRDEGYDGVVIATTEALSDVQVLGEEMVVGAGAKLSAVAVAAMENDLAGFEFAYGIPGTIGGAVVMNAGAYGGEMRDVIVHVKVIDGAGNVRTIPVDEMGMEYRKSIVTDENMVVLSARLKLMLGSADEVSTVMQLLQQRRRSSQPLDYPSAGSTFKRPEGYFAGKLIEEAGMAGHRVGGAMVAKKHCGFIINYDHATASDVLQVMSDVQAAVKDTEGVELEPEIRVV